MLKTIAVLLPALNEDREIEKVIKSVPKGFSFEDHTFVTKIYVADSESTDNTVEVALRNNCEVFMCNRGKGKTVRKAIEKIREQKPDYLFMLDSDTTYYAPYIIPMTIYLGTTPTDVIVGTRTFFSSPKSMTFLNYLGNNYLTSLSKLLYPISSPDLCSGFWGFNTIAYNTINIKAEGFDLEANILTEINRLKLNLTYLPIWYFPREESETKLRVKHGFEIAKFLIKERFKL